MADSLSMELAGKGLVTNQIVMDVGFDIENVAGGKYKGSVATDRYGRKVPKPVHGSIVSVKWAGPGKPGLPRRGRKDR